MGREGVGVSEHSYDIRAVEKDYACDHFGCGGFMRPTGAYIRSEPQQFPHECNVCGARKTFDVKYPCLAYRRAADVDQICLAVRIDERRRELGPHMPIAEAIAEMVKAGFDAYQRGAR
jgi:hypothetical protein